MQGGVFRNTAGLDLLDPPSTPDPSLDGLKRSPDSVSHPTGGERRLAESQCCRGAGTAARSPAPLLPQCSEPSGSKSAWAAQQRSDSDSMASEP